MKCLRGALDCQTRLDLWLGMALLLGGVLSGCTRQDTPRLGSWEGPATPAVATASRWSFGNSPARAVRTAHYNLYTTLTDDEILPVVAQVMEGALTQYRRLVPDLPLSRTPMETYLFQYRNEWADFTRSAAGPDAPVYLQIVRGGYTLGDRSAAYFIGDTSTYSVIAHEGFHQFVARHFSERLPPFLEEGLACLFESVTFVNGLPRWNLSINHNRMNKLRAAVAAQELWPLDRLIHMHAGEVIHLPTERIEAFYAQNWAFAKFLWEAEQQTFRPALHRMLHETARGELPAGLAIGAGADTWRPEAVAPLLEHYLQMPLEEIDRRYQAYIQVIVREEYARQWHP